VRRRHGREARGREVGPHGGAADGPGGCVVGVRGGLGGVEGPGGSLACCITFLSSSPPPPRARCAPPSSPSCGSRRGQQISVAHRP
jgi:hypothetical protein